MPAEVSFFSRFTVKLVEVVGAGIATAVSVYLIAHLSGYLSSPPPTPAAVQIAPSAGVSSAAEVSKSPNVQPTSPVSVDVNEQRPAPRQDVTPPNSQPARTTVSATQAAPPRKHAVTDAAAAESKLRDAESVEVQVRAALAKVDANRPAPLDVPPHQADVSPGPPAIGAQPRPLDGTSGAGAVTPRAADLRPQPVQQAPVQTDPLAVVEIKSRPIADVAASPPPQPAPPEEEDDKSLFSAIKKITSLLRPDPPAPPAGEAPRPPMPVGE